MKKLFFALQFPLFIAFNFFLLTAFFEFASSRSTSDKTSPKYDGKEEYDPSLGRLNSVNKLQDYCDSLFATQHQDNQLAVTGKTYPEIVAAVIRKRFYHGYSRFGVSNNLLAVLLSPLTGKNASAIVLPNEILKYPYAACSQQSIVTLELLKNKGIAARAIRFTGVKNGHFAYEAYYNGDWHFFDPNLEPDVTVLNKYNRPGIAFLAANKAILLGAYHHLPQNMVLDIFTHYNYGKVNATAAPMATFFQQATKILSYTLWIFFLMTFIAVRKKYRRLSNTHVRNSRVFIPQLQPGTSPTYYLGY